MSIRSIDRVETCHSRACSGPLWPEAAGGRRKGSGERKENDDAPSYDPTVACALVEFDKDQPQGLEGSSDTEALRIQSAMTFA